MDEYAMKYHLSNKKAAKDAIEFLDQVKLDGSYIVEFKKTPGKRTLQQNNGMWLWAKWLADFMNGSDKLIEIGAGIRIRWKQTMVVDLMIRPVLMARTGSESTSKASKVELSEAIDDLCDHFAAEWGCDIHFPNRN